MNLCIMVIFSLFKSYVEVLYQNLNNKYKHYKSEVLNYFLKFIVQYYRNFLNIY